MDLPKTIPLFPLPNAVLFPGVLLPLHIFEPRYREMVRDAQSSGHKLIGMVLLRGAWQAHYLERPEIFAAGCAGRMVRADRLEDGRYNVLLLGLREFRVGTEVGETSYRQAEVTWSERPTDPLSKEQRGTIRALMTRYLESRDPGSARRLLDDDSMSDEMLVNFLSYSLDFPPLEKLALLAAPAVCERASRLCEVLEFALGGGGVGGGELVH